MVERGPQRHCTLKREVYLKISLRPVVLEKVMEHSSVLRITMTARSKALVLDLASLKQLVAWSLGPGAWSLEYGPRGQGHVDLHAWEADIGRDKGAAYGSSHGSGHLRLDDLQESALRTTYQNPSI